MYSLTPAVKFHIVARPFSILAFLLPSCSANHIIINNHLTQSNRNGFDEEPIPEIGSDLLRGLDDDEEPIDSGPIAIEKLDEELPGAGEHLGDEPADVADEGNGLEDQETEDDEDIPGATLEIGDTDSTKKRNSTPKSAKGAASTAGRKRKADKSDEELPAKRSGRGRATAAAASDAIKTGATKKSRAAAATKVCRLKPSLTLHSSDSVIGPKDCWRKERPETRCKGQEGGSRR